MGRDRGRKRGGARVRERETQRAVRHLAHIYRVHPDIDFLFVWFRQCSENIVHKQLCMI